jgi:hypothetical protein
VIFILVLDSLCEETGRYACIVGVGNLRKICQPSQLKCFGIPVSTVTVEMPVQRWNALGFLFVLMGR